MPGDLKSAHIIIARQSVVALAQIGVAQKHQRGVAIGVLDYALDGVCGKFGDQAPNLDDIFRFVFLENMAFDFLAVLHVERVGESGRAESKRKRQYDRGKRSVKKEMDRTLHIGRCQRRTHWTHRENAQRFRFKSGWRSPEIAWIRRLPQCRSLFRLSRACQANPLSSNRDGDGRKSLENRRICRNALFRARETDLANMLSGDGNIAV
ncbi:MAG: hypothetical protein BWZ10_02748 [candidate division BRC1 bacterium ADurb.BinA364]|nr:MAG: hypothetical protein BWZ10_02748 [candidate division BRC1 bacterium ADurb.BinA364]